VPHPLVSKAVWPSVTRRRASGLSWAAVRAVGSKSAAVLLQQLDLNRSDRTLLAPAGDEGATLPVGAPQYAFQFKEIAPLGLGEHRAPMGVQLGNVEPDFAQLARHQDLEVLGSELW